MASALDARQSAHQLFPDGLLHMQLSAGQPTLHETNAGCLRVSHSTLAMRSFTRPQTALQGVSEGLCLLLCTEQHG